MKVLITGAGGQLGKALLKTAPETAEISDIDVEDVDLSDSAMLRARLAVEAPEVIINAAAYTAVDKAEVEEELALAINSDALKVMVEAVEQTGGKLVHISTDFVFDGTATDAYQPDDTRAPINAYGRTKLAGEEHVRPSDIILRTSWLYAAGGTNFVRTMIRLMNEREELSIVSDQVSAPTWATGLAQTVWGLLDKGAFGAFHHSDAGQASWYDFAVAIAEEAHALGLIKRIPTIKPIATSDYPSPARRPAFSLLDSSATRAVLGDLHTPWRENLRAMLREEKAFG
ncbi:dTDP-4-dehydrorhamnose reductase [uncultured Erythrobacter sp.]|uniref:dTDP-4-dehydrorhamnose reductase n=1 Tax=uncultured Erythrobacter sp. TaxID=263913 RepID=UPI0026095844|nr:dTDP-4-dehydrorhamnose reductase [uncultured Erythrobacter sp.]